MLIHLNEQNLSNLNNPAFRAYAGIYQQIYAGYLEHVTGTGLPLDEDLSAIRDARLTRLRERGVRFRNNDRSLVINRISPACEACQTGEGSSTFFISLKCHRSCYYCFNPNQEDYDYFRTHTRDVVAELEQAFRQGARFRCLALTGGEPLLYPDQTLEFFRYAKARSPKIHTRLYTSGDLLTPELLAGLKQAGLDEIRFSIKLEDQPDRRTKVLRLLEKATAYIPQVMVEMPHIPGTLAEIKDLLLELERIGIFGINLLEFCFPLANAEVFKQKGFAVKNPPHQILYDYWYAGGLPVSRSELEILELMEFALDNELKLGIHYCSLENKHSGQIYQQNNGQRVASYLTFSPKDYFFKSAKVFGDDIPQVEKIFKKKNITDYQINPDYNYLEFPVRHIQALKNLEMEIGIAYYIMETREDGRYLRELKIDLTTPQTFHMNDI